MNRVQTRLRRVPVHPHLHIALLAVGAVAWGLALGRVVWVLVDCDHTLVAALAALAVGAAYLVGSETAR